jgi:hypothetical protein
MDESAGRTSQSRTRTAAALLLLGTMTAPAAAAPEEIRYRETWGYGVVVPVYVQSAGPYDFLLDTGAETTVLHPDLAAELGLAAAGQVELVTVAGSRFIPQATVGSLRLGETSLGPAEVLIHDMQAARAADPRLRGILAGGALAGTSFTIDHARQRLRLGGVARADGVPYEPLAGRPVITARLGCSGDPLRLVLDSGVGGLVLFGGHAGIRAGAAGAVTARTNAGLTALRDGRLDALCLGSMRLADLPVAVQDAGGAEGRVEDGLLPTRLFARVHFDAQRRTVRLEPW